MHYRLHTFNNIYITILIYIYCINLYNLQYLRECVACYWDAWWNRLWRTRLVMCDQCAQCEQCECGISISLYIYIYIHWNRLHIESSVSDVDFDHCTYCCSVDNITWFVQYLTLHLSATHSISSICKGWTWCCQRPETTPGSCNRFPWPCPYRPNDQRSEHVSTKWT
jgi:hypothetical protein